MAIDAQQPTEQANAPASPTDALASPRRVFASGRSRSLEWRRRQLGGVERLLRERESDIASALAADLGRSDAEAFIGDIGSTRAEAGHARRNLRKWARPRRTGMPLSVRPGRAWFAYEPLGVVLVIGPWNYPVYLTLGPLVGALAAGNCAVVKPSEHAPETSRMLARLLPEYVDREAVVVIEGGADTTQELLSAGVDHAFFTGGTEVGRKVMAAAAPRLTPVTLELGGKSPVIVAADADVEVAARRIAWMKLINSGQTCIAPDYVLAESSIRDELVERLIAAMRDFRADAVSAGMPVVNRRQFDRLAAMLAGHGGRVVHGGGVDDDRVAIEPTVVVDPDPRAELMSDEIFGPVLPVLGVDGIDEAIGFVSARPKPLASYLFTRSKRTRREVLRRVSSGGAVVNHLGMHCLTPQLPFGGVGESGMGAYHGRWGFETFSHRKSIVAKPARPDPSVLYPPYTPTKMKIIRRFF